MDIFHRTTRLTLRRFEDTAADAQLLFDLDSDPEVTRYTGPGHATVGEYAAKIRNEFLRYANQPARGFFATYETAKDEFIGWFILRPGPDYRYAAPAGWSRPDEVEVGYRLKRAAWGKGYASEGATELVKLALADPTARRVVAAALVTNRASCRVIEKCGLVPVGEFTLPQFADPVLTFARDRPAAEPPGA